jgi:hypothetical protein
MNTVVKRNEAARLIQGVILKCVDGRWTDADGLTPPAQLLALGTTRALQCWREQKVLDTVTETPGEPLPDAAQRSNVMPIVKLDSRPMKTSFGTKMRPEFSIVEWRELDAPSTQPAVAQTTAPQIENKTTLRPTQTAAKKPAKPSVGKPAKPSVGKPVKPVSPEEDMDDIIPF